MTSSLYRWKTKRAFNVMSTEKKDQYEQYLEEEPVNTPTPNEEGNEDSDGIIIPYWRGVESKWPELARFAYDALSIPVISTECERCFSSSKKTIETRWALNADSIEAHDIQVCAIDLSLLPTQLISRPLSFCCWSQPSLLCHCPNRTPIQSPMVCRTAPGRRGHNSLSVRAGFASERLFIPSMTL